MWMNLDLHSYQVLCLVILKVLFQVNILIYHHQVYPMWSGPMASNQSNLEKNRYLPWFKGRYGVHAKVNVK